jgi:hypothetical protein
MLKLYDDYYRLVRNVISKIVQKSEDLDDLVQDAFIRLIEKITLLRTLDHCRKTAYIAYTGKSVAINYVKHRDVVSKYTFFGMESDLSEDLWRIRSFTGWTLKACAIPCWTFRKRRGTFWFSNIFWNYRMPKSRRYSGSRPKACRST